MAASGLTASVAAKVTPEEGKVMLTVTPAAQLDHKIYYRVVDTEPTAMNVGWVIDTANWTQVIDTNAVEVTTADGKYIEVVELADCDQTVSKWGKSASTEDGYIAVNGTTGSIALNSNSYRMGDTIEITVTDNDLNINAGTKQNLDVNIRSDSYQAGFTVALMETENNTGIFKGQVILKSSTNPGSAPKKLGAVVGDTITVTYDDSLDANGNNPGPIIATAQVIIGRTGVLTLSEASYSNGMIITLNDMNLNNHANSSESVKVNVKSSATDTTGFPVTLIETGKNTGVFTGEIKFDTTSKTNTKPKTLGAQVGETITVTYADELDDDGNTSTVISNSATVQ